MKKQVTVIIILIVVNVLFAAVTFLLPGYEETMFNLMGLYFPENEKFRIWQFVTSMFMHGGIAHLLFNMYGLWAFGSPLEEIMGKKKFTVFYFLAGIGAGVIYTLVNYYQFNSMWDAFVSAGISEDVLRKLLQTKEYEPALFSAFSAEQLAEFYHKYHTPAVGASGAIYGILVGFAMIFPNAKLALIFLPVPIAAKYFIPALLALDLFSGVTGVSIFGGGIAHFAHVGGGIIGFILMWIWKKNHPAVVYYQVPPGEPPSPPSQQPPSDSENKPM